jgi:hypothetical protein
MADALIDAALRDAAATEPASPKKMRRRINGAGASA